MSRLSVRVLRGKREGPPSTGCAFTAEPMPTTRPSDHLSWNELACKDTTRTPYPLDWRATRLPLLVREFEAVRAAMGAAVGREVPLRVLSAYRTRAYNAAIGGAPKSQHCEGRALDITPMDGGPAALELLRQVVLARAKSVLALRGVGFYPGFVHIDVRPSADLVLWDERGSVDRG
jgi:hypothetical protein